MNPTTTTTMRSFHGDAALKEHLIATVRVHREADELAKGIYYQPGNGRKAQMCAVGCILKDPGGGHERFEPEFGLPAEWGYLTETIFEGLPDPEHKTWVERVVKATPVDVDLRPTMFRIRARVLREVAKEKIEKDKWGVLEAIEFAARLCEMEARGEIVSAEENERILDMSRWAARAAGAATGAAWAAWGARAAWAAGAAWAAWAAGAAGADAWRRIAQITVEEFERAGRVEA